MAWTVHKFGGTSVADAARIRAAADRILDDGTRGRRAVVVSAMAGVTDALLGLLAVARAPDGSWAQALDALLARHREALDGLDLSAADRAEVLEALERGAADLEHLLRTVRLVGGVPEQAADLVGGYGELWSAPLVAAHLRSRGEDAAWLDARDVLVVDHGETGPIVDWSVSARKLDAWLAGRDERTVVVTGFVARTPNGIPTTLKRNGSDFTASIFGALLEADEVTIWTDVDGVLSADPRLVPDAFPLPRLSYDEAMELAYFGARVLHPQTMAPVVRRGIPIRIRNSRNPDAPGTEIGPALPRAADAPVSPAESVRGFSTVDGVALLNVEGTGMIGVPGVSERLFGALRRAGISVILISQASSEHSICLAVPGEQAERARTVIREAFFAELHHGQIQNVELDPDCTLLAAVGDAMAHTPGVAARLFGSLGRAGVNVRAVAQGGSERNITVVIRGADSARALRAAHAGFYLSDQALAIGVVGGGTVGRALIEQLAAQAPVLERGAGIDLRVRGIARSSEMHLAPDGQRLDLRGWLDGPGAGSPTDLDAFVAALTADPVPHRVLVDCTASADVAERYPAWLDAGIHVVTPNKHAGSAPRARWRLLRDARARRRAQFLDEATVGAGLPILNTLRDLIATGDRVRRIEGVLSGTLSTLFNEYDGSEPFSRRVRDARAAGYTEPDPRDDLSGTDVARKLVILAREAGLDIDLDELAVESLIPADAAGAGSVEEFLRAMERHDETLRRRVAEARAESRVLRYVGAIEGEPASGRARAEVALRAYPLDHPFAGLTGTDNILAFTTDRYDVQPLIVRGPGAGPQVTAGGVFGDLLRLAASLGRTP